MTRWFKGIDFASRADNVGLCYLEVADRTLTVHHEDRQESFEGTGIDCPFGTSLGFWKLLCNEDPGHSEDGFKTRHTERWLRNHLSQYQTNGYWQHRVAANPQLYLNQTAHVHPAVGFQIIPGFLDWFRNQVGDSQFGAAIRAARRGENASVEAHPRAFLCSAVERIWRSMNPPGHELHENTLRAVVQYRDARNVSRVNNRRRVYQLLQQHAQAWLGRGYQLAEAQETLFSTDHKFDAWLCALTAFAHTEQLTIGWQSAEMETGGPITEAEVDIEGHILILKQERPTARA